MTVFFSPGPSQLYPGMREFLADALRDEVASISHRSKRFEQVFETAVQGVRSLLGLPADHHVMFVGSGTEAMERVVQGASKSCTFHFVNGAFSNRFYQTAQELGREALQELAAEGQGFDFGSINVPDHAELIAVTHNETSSGVMLSRDGISTLRIRYPDKILAVDIVSSAPFAELDYRYVDYSFFSVQKCFGLPSGLGVLTASPAAVDRATALHKAGHSIGAHHSILAMLQMAQKHQTVETPPVLHIYLLGRVCEAMLRFGIGPLRQQHLERAARLYSATEGSKGLSPFVRNERLRSTSVLTVECPGVKSALLQALSDQGIEVGAGYGKFKDSQIRIANFPAPAQSDFERLIAVLTSF